MNSFAIILSDSRLVEAYYEFFIRKERPLSVDHATNSDALEFAEIVFSTCTGYDAVRCHELSECLNPHWCLQQLRRMRKHGGLPSRKQMREQLEIDQKAMEEAYA